MGLLVYVLLDPLTAVLPQTGIGLVVTVALEISIGGTAFACVAYLLGAPELWQVRLFVGRGK
jgi:hypothetical protein